MTPHTPAPWHHIRVNENVIKIKAEHHHLGESVCKLEGTFGDSVTLADARLIAAAPELLDALKELYAAVHEYHLLDIKKRFSLCTADAAASKAIARAEGKV